MARPAYRLSATKITKGALEPGLIADGNGLYLRVSKALTRSWVFLYVRNGKRTELGLGAFPAVSLADARERAAEAQAQLAKGLDPKTVKRAEAPPVLSIMCERFVASFGETVSARRRRRWEATFRLHLGALASIPVDKINTSDIARVLVALQNSRPIVAKELRGLLERVFDYAKASGFRQGDNPAAWNGNLAFIVPKLGKPHEHHGSMPYADCPAFFRTLKEKTALAAQALQFLMLTAVRKDEVRLMTWDEVDMDACIWTIPAERTKTGKPLRVPLTAPALAILNAQGARHGRSGLVFRGRDGRGEGAPLGAGSMNWVIRDYSTDGTVHGFRTSFRVWVAEQSNFGRDLAEMSLGHVVGSSVERAYQRSDLLEKRGELMKAWAAYLTAPSAAS